MEKYAWSATLKDGKKDEYVKRHNEIWPELVEVLKTAGIRNYTIWLSGNTLFGYYECEKGIKFATDFQANSPVVDRWNEYMKDVMDMPVDPDTGAQPKLIKVFSLD
ncbi:MAG: L-rhamnose mutarotase [Clostridia bacterium]|nr:L-rhamnose mutarotase [Clostridia bacterium]